MAELTASFNVPAAAGTVYEWCARPAALERLCPPWETPLEIDCQGGVSDGGRVLIGIRHGRKAGVRQYRYAAYEPHGLLRLHVTGFGGPYEWSLRATPTGKSASTVTLAILPETPPSRRQEDSLRRLLHYQQRRLHNDLARMAPYSGRPPLRVVISGATGLVGSHLATFLRVAGHRVDRLMRTPVVPGSNDIEWSPTERRISAQALEGADIVVHLAGANIADRRWNAAFKREIRDSRTVGTRLLSEALAGLTEKPRLLISASATGIYDATSAGSVDESGPLGDDFLAGVCREWEAATQPASDAGIRVVKLRTGMVLAARGGALAKMLRPFRLGLGGTLGHGRQYMNWIALDDLVGMLYFLMHQPDVAGPINATSPQPASNHKFTKRLGRVLRRPTIMRVPSCALRLALGEMGAILLRGDAQVLPTRIRRLGFEFLYLALEDALRGELGTGRGK
ncbi:MAG: TIGR01777 family oxidoreductase [Phycisphaerae bacterium]|nr:TIGR01777 family oxidoreductase [Phycisphaerae bacterium]